MKKHNYRYKVNRISKKYKINLKGMYLAALERNKSKYSLKVAKRKALSTITKIGKGLRSYYTNPLKHYQTRKAKEFTKLTGLQGTSFERQKRKVARIELQIRQYKYKKATDVIYKEARLNDIYKLKTAISSNELSANFLKNSYDRNESRQVSMNEYITSRINENPNMTKAEAIDTIKERLKPLAQGAEYGYIDVTSGEVISPPEEIDDNYIEYLLNKFGK